MENPLEYENKRRKENKFNLQCDKCSNIPNFTLYNYIDCIKLNVICKEIIQLLLL